jgi:hypothetical protein
MSNEETVRELVERTGCDDHLGKVLLKFTGGDLNGAIRILEAVPKDIFAVKMKFITQITGYLGAFFFCYDEKEKRIKRLIGIVGDDKEIGKIDIGGRWLDFEEVLYSYAISKRVDGMKIEQIKKRIQGDEFIARLSGILAYGKTVRKEDVNNLFVDELYNVFTDTNIAVKLNVEMTDAFELNKSRDVVPDDREEGELNPEEVDEEIMRERRESQREKSLIVLRLDPVLSPVSGLEIRELEYGDEIQVRISDEREIADYLAELLGGKVDSIRVPIYSKIIDKKEMEGDFVGVYTQFGPGIMGTFMLPSDAKVVTKREHAEADEPLERARREIHPLVVVGGIVAVIIMLILLVFMSR